MVGSETALIPQERGGFRTLSAVILEFRLRPPEDLLEALAALKARQAQGRLEVPPGEVATLQAEAPAAACERPLRRALRASGLDRALRPSFDWLVCASVAYHDDIHAFAEVLLGVWCLETPPMDLVLPRLGRRLSMRSGLCVVFDPGQPHALLQPGHTDAGEVAVTARARPGDALTWLVGFQLELNPQAARHFGVGRREASEGALVIGPGLTLVGSASGDWRPT